MILGDPRSPQANAGGRAVAVVSSPEKGEYCKGLGAVGWYLAEYLHKAGAKLVVADVNADKVSRAQAEFGATAVSVSDILTPAASQSRNCPCSSGVKSSSGMTSAS